MLQVVINARCLEQETSMRPSAHLEAVEDHVTSVSCLSCICACICCWQHCMQDSCQVCRWHGLYKPVTDQVNTNLDKFHITSGCHGLVGCHCIWAATFDCKHVQFTSSAMPAHKPAGGAPQETPPPSSPITNTPSPLLEPKRHVLLYATQA